MDGIYKLAIDRSRNLIDVAFTGYWCREATEAFCNEMLGHIATLGTGAGQHVVLCDVSGANVAPADTIAALAQILSSPSYIGIKSRRLAFHTQSALLRMQLNRLTSAREGVAVFETRAQAEAWLAEPAVVAAA